jgi:hypothetical protein
MSCTDPVTQAITVDDFKQHFFRDFNYIDTWVAGTFNTGDQVFYDVNNKFYECLQDSVTSIPTTVGDWKEISNVGLISDKDITNAYAEACVNFNASLFNSDEDVKLAYLYLAAHFLVYDLNVGGVESSANGQLASRSVGNVSEGYTVPQWILDNPAYSFLAKTNYGLKYINLIGSRLIGQFFTVKGATHA